MCLLPTFSLIREPTTPSDHLALPSDLARSRLTSAHAVGFAFCPCLRNWASHDVFLMSCRICLPMTEAWSIP